MENRPFVDVTCENRLRLSFVLPAAYTFTIISIEIPYFSPFLFHNVFVLNIYCKQKKKKKRKQIYAVEFAQFCISFFYCHFSIFLYFSFSLFFIIIVNVKYVR